jgi:hypothetical protein
MVENFDDYAPYLQQLGERLLRAGWATSLVNEPDSFGVHWTEHGIEQMRQLWETLRELQPAEMPHQEWRFLQGVLTLAAESEGWDSSPPR